MEGSIMVDWRCIGRGRRKCWVEIWSLHSYRGHESDGKEIWRRLKQSLRCIAHSRTLTWLAYCFRIDQNGCWRSAFPHEGGVEELMGAVPCHNFAMPFGELTPVEKSMREANSTG